MQVHYIGMKTEYLTEHHEIVVHRTVDGMHRTDFMHVDLVEQNQQEHIR